MDAPRSAVLTDEEVAARLREAGLRVTQPRLRVYAVLRDLGGHQSADEVLAELGLRGHPLPRQSAYNAIAALCGAGLLLRADAGPGRTLYETNTVWHHHFVCRRCGRVFDAPCVRGRKPCLRPPRGFGEVDEAQVIFRGRCRSCARR
jgi:Fur family ferric uptake transcriptional regulator